MRNIVTVILIMTLNSLISTAQTCVDEVISNDITINKTFLSGNVYRIDGVIEIVNNSILTIEPGAIVLFDQGDYLISEPGTKIYAVGTPTSPVIFTRVPPVIGPIEPIEAGVIIRGDAQINEPSLALMYGIIHVSGNDDLDNSGILNYVQFSYLNGDENIPSLNSAITLLGVGNQTELENIQISQTSGNALGIVGGSPVLNDIYIQDAAKSGIYATYGARSEISNLLVLQKDKSRNHIEGTQGMTIENHPEDINAEPLTMMNMTHASFIGIRHCESELISNNFKNGIILDLNSGINISNSVITGYNGYGFYISDQASVDNTAIGRVQVNNTSFENNIQGDYGFDPLLSWTSGCGVSMNQWIEGGAPCSQIGNQLSGFALEYDASICDDFCNNKPQFKLTELTELEPLFDLIKHGALQFEESFTWIEPCPQDIAYCKLNQLELKSQSMQIVPNPASSFVSLIFESSEKGSAIIQVLDKVSMRMLYEQIHSIETIGKQNISINVSVLKEGVYPVRIIMNDQVINGMISIK